MNNMFWLIEGERNVVGVVELSDYDYAYTSICTQHKDGTIHKYRLIGDNLKLYSRLGETYSFILGDNGIYYGDSYKNKKVKLVPFIKYNNNKLDLNNVTMICLDGMNPKRSVRAIEICKKYCNFSDVKLLSSVDFDYEHHVKIPYIIDSREYYSEFMVSQIYKYCNTDYMLIVQHDGWILNPNMWKNEWLDFDYVGANISHFDKDYKIGGNGGFSLRSKRIMEYVALNHDKRFCRMPEDKLICVKMGDQLVNNGFKFSNDDDFSVDHKLWTHSFGFHKSDNRLWINS